MKKINYRHYIFTYIVLVSLTLSVFHFTGALTRIIESFRDLGLSVAYYFCELLEISHSITPTVSNTSIVPWTPILNLPATWEEFLLLWDKYWLLWSKKETFIGYINWLGNALLTVAQWSMLFIIPLALVLYLLFDHYMNEENNDYTKQSKAVTKYKAFLQKVYVPVKNWIISLMDFAKEHQIYTKLLLVIWLWNFNGFSIFVEFLSFYFYFVVQFSIDNLYIQVYKLFVDLTPMLAFVPTFVWIILALIAFHGMRKRIGYNTLQHNEMKNRGFINERPIVSMCCGTMGKGKTTQITDMALSTEVMFRDKAFEKILEQDLKFPYFPWITLENEIKKAMRKHIVYNLATCKNFIKWKYIKFFKHPKQQNIFGYNFEKYGLEYNNHLEIQNIWQVLETYTQLYFIYVIQSSLLISNYSVRVDSLLDDIGNFPLWNTDFFKSDTRLMDSYSRHAHILDFDTLRLGKKVIENNELADSFEFGVILVTEIGKERGNSKENKEIKKSSAETNQLNDMFNDWLKMIRHSATVDNYPFVKVFTDEQRPSSWGADARDLCEVIYIKEKSETRLTMPFFALEDLFFGWCFDKFRNLYYKYRFLRSDNTLPIFLLKSIFSKFYNYHTRIYNTFGYNKLAIQIESGTLDGNLIDKSYYLSHKKIYSKRFSTDCFSDFFYEKAIRSTVGLDDLPTYLQHKASLAELCLQNSFFITNVCKAFDTNKGENV